MKCFDIIVAPASEQKGKTLRFAAMDYGWLLVGKSDSLVADFLSSHVTLEKERGIFASGSCEEGQLIFDDSTPELKRDEVRDFLAGAGLELSMEKAESRQRTSAEARSFMGAVAQDPNTTIARF